MTIVSHKHKYIFLKTRKTAGTSVEALLAKYAGPDDILAISHDVTGSTTLNTQNTSVPRYSVGISGARRFMIRSLSKKSINFKLNWYQHMTAKEIKESVGSEIWHNYTKITIERNPYHRLISFWRWRSAWFDLDVPFETFALSALSGSPWSRIKSKSSGFSNRPFYKLPFSESICCDHVVSYEKLESDLMKISDTLGVPKEEVLENMPTFKGSGSRYDLEKYYTEKAKAVAQRRFSFEEERFGYKFG